MLTADDTERAADALADATHSGKPIQPLTDIWPGLTVEDAYAIQLHGVRAAVRSGRRVVGYKIGLTSAAMQEQFGVPEPDFGHLLDAMAAPPSGEIPLSTLCAPRAEPEVAFVLGGGVRAPGATAADVLRATEAVLPAVEVVDSRIVDWRITIADTVADNASSGRFVLGGPRRRVDQVNLAGIAVELAVNGTTVHTGSTAAVLGDPAAAVAWLANRLSAFGVHMGPGDLVLSGACTAAVPVQAGDVVIARFGPFGAASVRFG